MHPGNEANQDDRQIIRRPILRAIARDGDKTTFTLVDRIEAIAANSCFLL